jgi:hypothetical protein
MPLPKFHSGEEEECWIVRRLGVFHPNGPQRWCHLALLKFQAVWNYATRIPLEKKPQEKTIAKKHAFTRDFKKIQFKRKGVGKTPVTEKAIS